MPDADRARQSGPLAPLVVLLTQDLFLQPRFSDVLHAAGFRLQVVESPADLSAEGEVSDRPVPLTEPLTGADAGLVRTLTEWRPALMLVDLTAEGLPWARWIHTLKTSAATRRIPILAFGPHVEADKLAQAKLAGADRALPRGQMVRQLAKLAQRYARTDDLGRLRSGCRQPLSELARQGVQLHNAGEYFEAHEALEHAWLQMQDEAGYLYRALLQVTVAYLHIERGNYRGASKMLLRIRQWLDPLPDECRGVDVVALKAMVEELRQEVQRVGPDGLDQLDRNLLRPFPIELPPSK